MKVFVFFGQSNAQGYGNRTQLNPVPAWAQTAANGWTGAPTVSSDSGVQYQHPTLANSPSLYNSNNTGLMSGVMDSWGTYDGHHQMPNGSYGEDGSYGPELSFLAKYRAEHPGEEIAAIKCVLGGSSLESDWTGAPYNLTAAQKLDPANWNGGMWAQLCAMLSQAAARLTAAGKSFEWAGLIWMQGESGASGTYYYVNQSQYGVAIPTYAQLLRAFIAQVRLRTSATVPFIIGRIGDQMLADEVINPQVTGGNNTADNLRGATNMRRAEQVAVAGDVRNGWWSEDGLPRLESSNPAYWYHHTPAGYLAAGERAYAAWQVVAGETPPPPPTPLAVKFNGTPQAWTVKLNGAVIGGNNDVIDITG